MVGHLGDGLFERINVQTAFVGAAGFALDAGPLRRHRGRGPDQALDGRRRPAGHRDRRPHEVAARRLRDVLPHRRDRRGPDRRPGAGRDGPRAARPRHRGHARARGARRHDRGRRARGRRGRPRPAHGHHQAVRRDPGAGRRVARPARRRGPRARRRERRGQEHAGQDPRPASTSRTAGTIRIDGEPTVIHGPAHARALGIAVVHQEPRLFPDLSVAENVYIGHAPSGPLRTVDWGATRGARRRRCSRSSTSGSTSRRWSAACRWPTSS